NSTFSLPPDFSSQAASTNGSFTAMHTTRSTPCFLKSSALSMKPGRCLRWQVGVKAPGTANRTTRLPANTSLVVKISSPLGRATLNVASGRLSPTLIAMLFSLNGWLSPAAPYRLAQARPRELLRRPGGLARTLRDEDQLERLSLDGGSLRGRGEGHGKALLS